MSPRCGEVCCKFEILLLQVYAGELKVEHTLTFGDPWVPSLHNFIPLLKPGTVIGRNINRVQDLIMGGDNDDQAFV